MFDYAKTTTTWVDDREPVVGYQECIGDIEALSQDVPGLELGD